ncbi:hypothetical protein R69746_08664 [Paraburkholderia aspalathi]|nr:hypothetical protein R69746_08664 [Paraburkholderia aspalathi]
MNVVGPAAQVLIVHREKRRSEVLANLQGSGRSVPTRCDPQFHRARKLVALCDNGQGFDNVFIATHHLELPLQEFDRFAKCHGKS